MNYILINFFLSQKKARFAPNLRRLVNDYSRLFISRRILLLFWLCVFAGVVTWSQKKERFEPYQPVCDYDRYDVTQWFSGNNRKLDSNGVIITVFSGKTSYHPLSIVQFGMLSFYHFKTTNDSVYYRHFMNQVAYFKDTTMVNYYNDGQHIGLPYTFDYKDLKAPWYSGMTQGWAIAFLLRYYYHTLDEEIVPVIKKIGQFMIQPVEKNGTISKTPEGYTWIEEYPNSKQKPQVLNGFINGLIGLKEYCDFFPEDTMAKRIHDESLQSLLTLLHKYDTPGWSNYDRKNSPLNNQYLQYQLFEIIDLYNVYGLQQFLDQMKLWCYYGYKKYMNEKHKQFRLNNFDVSAKAEPHGKGHYTRFVRHNLLKSEYNALQQTLNNTSSFEVMFLGKSLELNFNVEQHHHKPQRGYLTLDSAYDGKKVVVFFKDTLTGKQVKQKCKKSVIGHNNVFEYDVPSEIGFQKITYSVASPSNNLASILDIALVSDYNYNLPFYNFIPTQTQYLTKGSYRLKRGVIQNGAEYTIFFRFNVKQDGLVREKWNTTNQLSLTSESIILPQDGYYEFLVMYKPLHEHSYIENFQLTRMD
jgi:heparosan-N-sulfate-glucuronate 5-epimerase